MWWVIGVTFIDDIQWGLFDICWFVWPSGVLSVFFNLAGNKYVYENGNYFFFMFTTSGFVPILEIT